MLKERVQSTIEVIRPAIQADGGDIVLREVDEETGVVTVELVGACVTLPGVDGDAARRASSASSDRCRASPRSSPSRGRFARRAHGPADVPPAELVDAAAPATARALAGCCRSSSRAATTRREVGRLAYPLGGARLHGRASPARPVRASRR